MKLTLALISQPDTWCLVGHCFCVRLCFVQRVESETRTLWKFSPRLGRLSCLSQSRAKPLLFILCCRLPFSFLSCLTRNFNLSSTDLIRGTAVFDRNSQALCCKQTAVTLGVFFLFLFYPPNPMHFYTELVGEKGLRDSSELTGLSASYF